MLIYQDGGSEQSLHFCAIFIRFETLNIDHKIMHVLIVWILGVHVEIDQKIVNKNS